MSKVSDSPSRSEKQKTVDDSIRETLEQLLETNEKITFHAVTRLVSEVSAVSSITRDRFRRELVEQYQCSQNDRADWIKRANKLASSTLIKNLADRDMRILDLEKQVEVLTASHKAMIHVNAGINPRLCAAVQQASLAAIRPPKLFSVRTPPDPVLFAGYRVLRYQHLTRPCA